MKNTGVILIGVTSGVVAAVIAYALISGAQASSTPRSDADVIQEAREAAGGAPNTEVKTASLAATTAPDGAVPLIEVETNDYDMGIIANDKLSEGQVMVYNRGNAALKITKVNTQCGCTKGKMSKDTIEPGKSAPLEITVDPFKIPQFDSSKTLTLFTNDPENPTVKVQVAARVNPEVIVEPDRIEFGEVNKGQTQTATVRLIQNTDAALVLKNLQLVGQSEHYETKMEEIAPEEWANPDRREYLVTAKVLENAPTGKLRANIVLETEFPRLPRVTVPMGLEVKGLYKIDPQVVTLRSVTTGQTIEDVLKITSEIPFEVLGVESTNDFLTVTHAAGEEPNSVMFDVAVAEDPAQRWQRDTWTLTIKADGKEFKEDVKVMAIINDVSGGAETPAAATVAPESRERIQQMRQQALERLRNQQSGAESPEPAPQP